jgi:hypothetical protein
MTGVLARDPTARPENYVLIGIGANNAAWLLEAKTTVASSTTVTPSAWSPTARLRHVATLLEDSRKSFAYPHAQLRARIAVSSLSRDVPPAVVAQVADVVGRHHPRDARRHRDGDQIGETVR